MKKTLCLVLALLLVLALFAGCGGNGGTTPATNAPDSGSSQATQAPAATKAPATQTPASSQATEAPATEAPEEDEGPYHFAAGKYAKNADGFPLEKYVYERPLTDNDDVLTKWSTCYTPQYIPEDGWGSIPVWKGVRDYTGVHIEYNIVDSSNRSQNFSVLLASDDLDDICDQGSYFYSGGTLKNAIEDGYFVNLKPYQDYMPNYMWETWDRSQTNPDVMNTVFYDKDTIASMAGMLVEPAPGMGLFLRQDWMDKLGLGKAIDVTTYDEFHKCLVAFKNMKAEQGEDIFPMFINNCVEVQGALFFTGYDTAVVTTRMSNVRLRDGKVEFCGTTEDDRDAMTLLSTWFSEGLISPNFQTFKAGDDYDAGLTSDGLGSMWLTPSEWETTESSNTDPNTDWEPIKRLVKKDGQILHYGNKLGGFHYGSAIVSGNCPNVELAVSWLDWWMSDWGSWWTSWGPEGTLWEYNDKGEMRLTDWCMNWEGGMAWCMCLYGCNGLVEFCLQIHKRNYAYDGGERALAAFDVFTPTDYYDGAYEWPSSVKLNDDEREETNALFSDLNTYYEENYVQFVDGTKPMSEWDNYLNDIKSFGYDRIQELYQQAYDRYVSEQ